MGNLLLRNEERVNLEAAMEQVNTRTEKPASQRALCVLEEVDTATFNATAPRPLYGVFLFRGRGTVTIDFTEYPFDGNIVLFTTPWQHVRLESAGDAAMRSLWFHGDYYCIEYHKQEVACNGLLFNNIYTEPFISIDSRNYVELDTLFDRLQEELTYSDEYSRAVARTYLQLILALSSKAKMKAVPERKASRLHHPVLRFRELLELHFSKERSPAFYAAQLGLSPNAFSKKCRILFHKSPSVLIHERVILEAKKLIHLTVMSMKEIAAVLNFTDENYFSRYFKKHTGISPTAFRETVGISVVAYPSR